MVTVAKGIIEIIEGKRNEEAVVPVRVLLTPRKVGETLQQ